jgi:hypothetical protein
MEQVFIVFTLIPRTTEGNYTSKGPKGIGEYRKPSHEELMCGKNRSLGKVCEHSPASGVKPAVKTEVPTVSRQQLMDRSEGFQSGHRVEPTRYKVISASGFFWLGVVSPYESQRVKTRG